MERYILKYLLDYSVDPRRNRLLDYLKYELDRRLWSMGNHLSNSFESSLLLTSPKNDVKHKVSVLNAVKRCIRSILRTKNSSLNINVINLEEKQQYSYKVLCLVSDLPSETLSLLDKSGVRIVMLSNYNNKSDSAIGNLTRWFEKLELLSFNKLLMQKNAIELDELFKNVLNEVRKEKYDALLVKTSELFYEKFFIDIFKEIKKTSITLLHGLPGLYSLDTESRSNYLLVYGKQIKRNFECVGYESSRVLVGGNYKYCSPLNTTSLRCSLENVLVLTTSTYNENQHEWEWTKFSIQDRSLVLTYLYSVEFVLKKIGCCHARLRPHPIIRADWFKDYINMDFYELDNEEYNVSLAKATLCIGPTSTAFLEAINKGVAYLVYEPGDGQVSMNNIPLVPPFDGTDKRLKIAHTEEQLESMIKQAYCPDVSLLNDYMQPFDINLLKKIICNL